MIDIFSKENSTKSKDCHFNVDNYGCWMLKRKWGKHMNFCMRKACPRPATARPHGRIPQDSRAGGPPQIGGAGVWQPGGSHCRTMQKSFMEKYSDAKTTPPLQSNRRWKLMVRWKLWSGFNTFFESDNWGILGIWLWSTNWQIEVGRQNCFPQGIS